MPTDSQMLDDFVRVGRNILSCDWSDQYGSDVGWVARSRSAVRYAQPGFVGRDYRGLVIVGQNPAEGDGRYAAHREWDRVLGAWRDQGTEAAYWDAFAYWRRDVREWRAWKMYVTRTLKLLGFTENHIGYLNLCKNATTDDKDPSDRMFARDWEWTAEQLAILRPRVVVAGGVDVGDRLAKLWPAPSCIVLPQNRDRRQNTAELDRAAAALADAIYLALQ